MRMGLSKSEHYEKLAHKYHELAKYAQPNYLGDFYRGVAVRYVFMAQEVSTRAEKEIVLRAERWSRRGGPPELRRKASNG
jgi:hypothetical protein